MPLTPDAIPTNEQLRESLADRFYHPHKKAIWAGGAVLFLGIVGFLAVREFRRQRLDEMWGRYYDITEEFTLNPFVAPDATAARKQLEQLDVLLKEYPDDAV